MGYMTCPVLNMAKIITETKLSEQVLVYPHTHPVTLSTTNDSNKQHRMNICHQIENLHIIAAAGEIAFQF